MVTKLIGLMFVWVLLGVIAILYLWPDVPRNQRQWAVLIVFGPPLYLAAEYIAARLFSDEVGQRISTRRFSVSRILVALVLVLVVIGLVVALSTAF